MVSSTSSGERYRLQSACAYGYPNDSPFPHHLPITSWRRFESCRLANIHSGASFDAGKDHKVRDYEGRSSDGLIDPLPHSFMAHPEGLLPIPEIDDPVKRFVSVVKFYLSGWHIKPP